MFTVLTGDKRLSFETEQDAITCAEYINGVVLNDNDEVAADFYNKPVVMTEDELKALDAKELKPWEVFEAKKNGAQYIGSVMGAYGDYNYYMLGDGTFGYEYFSIGD